MHAYHEQLRGYDPRQIWHDDCDECEQRGQHARRSIGTLDSNNFRKAWRRAADWNQYGDVGHVSASERELLELFWAMQVAFERECGLEIGRLPSSPPTACG